MPSFCCVVLYVRALFAVNIGNSMETASQRRMALTKTAGGKPESLSPADY